MSKNNKQEPPHGFTGKAYVAYKIDDFLCESAELSIENGVVVGTKVLTRGPDLPVMAISKIQVGLWASYKVQKAPT